MRENLSNARLKTKKGVTDALTIDVVLVIVGIAKLFLIVSYDNILWELFYGLTQKLLLE